MNRHRAYWSAMGIEPGTHREEMRQKLEEELEKLVSIYGLDHIITVLRKMKLENREAEHADKKRPNKSHE